MMYLKIRMLGMLSSGIYRKSNLTSMRLMLASSTLLMKFTTLWTKCSQRGLMKSISILHWMYS